jgi:1,2-phenylacetyl-CoA epoxidase catalytic subunit
MNERIKELAEQATLAVTKPDGHYIVQSWQAKFAELIVRECANIPEQKQTYNDGHGIHLNIDQCILSEFGVEK